jgi:D-alanyl-D-alanine carboxypeptidase
LLGVLLGAQNNDILFMEAKDLLEYGFKNYKVQTMASSGEFFGRYEVVDAMDNIPVDLQTLGTVSHLLPISEEEKAADVTVKETLNTPFTAPIQKGQVLGYKTWFYKGEEIGNVQLVAVNDIEKTLTAQIRDRFKELANNKTIRAIAITLVCVIVFFILLRTILRGVSRRRNYNRRHYRI